MVRLRGTVLSWSPSSMWMLFAAVFNAVRVGEAAGRDTIGDLAQWLEDRGGSVGGLAVADVPGRGRGLLAATKLVPNRRLISVPSQCVLYERHVKDETVEMQRLVSYLQANATAQDMVSNKFLLSAFILEQLQHRSPSKRFAPYLRDLRKSAQTMLPRLPLFWPAEDQAELQGTMAEHELPRMRRAMRIEYDVLSAAAPNLAASHPLAEYQAAYSFVAARSFTLPPEAGEDAVLYPFIDMANHEILEPNATLNSEEFEEHLREAAAARVEVKHQADGFTAHLFSQRAFLARQEVTVAYGFHPNYYALLRYGFVTPWMHRWTCLTKVRLELAVDWLPRGEKSRWKKLLRKVAGNAVSFNVEACAVPGPGLSDALAFARLWSSEQGPASLKRCGLDLNQASWKEWKLDIACFLHTASAEHKALDLVEGALAMARQRLAGGSLEEEEQLLSDNSLLPNLRMAVTLRRDEKDTIQKLETFLHHARARLRRAGSMWRYYFTEEAVVKSKHAEL
ncbi:SETD4 [Symbiodinium sp. CCMP2592]|nr:SETD4 [Symbiodinium sp. CCMP2592]